MAYQNPYAVATKIDPAKEREVLARLKTNPQQMADLGLDPNEDFGALKNDPVKYNKVLSFVKGQAYQTPAYGALAGGQSKTDFSIEQAGKDYSMTPTQFRANVAPSLKTQYGVDENAYAQTMNKLRENNDNSVNSYIGTMNDYIRGGTDRAAYINSLNELSSASRTLKDTKTNFDDAYRRYQEAEKLAVEGYSEARGEKTKAAQDMYDTAKELLDQSMADEKSYQSAFGKIYNPKTGLYEAKPKSSGTKKADDDEKEIKAFQKDAADWIGKLDDPDPTKRVAWGTAFDSLKAKYPKAAPETINQILGGGVKYDPQKGFDPSTAYGRAKR